ncbi:MAG: 2-C-methyl-D-erythritol 4-phosphate cytidylyltransferase [Acidobacteria bacterium]|nr:2-C-methyl-D-erythritol 4-phosphate cytidylyltransferase [Acidobacteriota bacterium]
MDRMTPVVSVLIAAGGRGARLGAEQPKQFLEIGGRSILERSVRAFADHPRVAEVIVALPAETRARVAATWHSADWRLVSCVDGGARRQDSVARALAAARPDAEVILIHDAARPFVSARVIDAAIDAGATHGAAVVAVPVRDTVKRAGGNRGAAGRPITETLPREDVFLAQTPQAFRRDVLERAVTYGRTHDLNVTDEAMLVEQAGTAVYLVEGEPTNVKITTADDLAWARRHAGEEGTAALTLRMGTGYDLHRLVEGRPLILGGVTIPFEKGLAGHSDADIVCHAVTDAILGAAAAGDIGRLFPDTDPQWKDADSIVLLRAAVAHLHGTGYRVGNVDVTVIAQRPKLLPYIDAMRQNLAGALDVPVSAVSVKGKTNETVDSMGRGESMACHAVATVIAGPRS